MKFKIAFTDIDGTLLNKEREIDIVTKEQVKRISPEIPFILISSRMPSAMYHLQRDLEIEGLPIICYNGGLILVDNKPIHSTEIPIELHKVISNIAKETPFHISLYNNDDWYVPSMDFWAKREENNTKVTPTVAETDAVIEKWEQEEKGAHKIMCMGEEEAIDVIFNFLKENHSDVLHLYRSKPTYLEIANKEISKLTAIKTLLKHSYPEFSLEESIAFGDNYNDMEMLEAVGFGVAVQNAKPEVLEIADAVVDTNHNHGVAQAIEKFL
ncbi:HAD family hydrolase [Aureivirga sp. CE67]|uniref:HAD family hydrolase n=1 Tax=Aureivirga sp. CE67 TaxID=1788983 RepID=UPI0018CAC689|nr:HAD family hydrolase [Aureivirga sp. CE67]